MKAYELIEKPEHWTTGVGFRNKDGLACDVDDAYSYCALGALIKVYRNYCNDRISLIYKHLDKNITDWNDNSDHQTVYNTLKELDL